MSKYLLTKETHRLGLICLFSQGDSGFISDLRFSVVSPQKVNVEKKAYMFEITQPYNPRPDFYYSLLDCTSPAQPDWFTNETWELVWCLCVGVSFHGAVPLDVDKIVRNWIDMQSEEQWCSGCMVADITDTCVGCISSPQWVTAFSPSHTKCAIGQDGFSSANPEPQ